MLAFSFEREPKPIENNTYKIKGHTWGVTPKLGLWPAHRHTYAHACTYVNIPSHVYTRMYTYHTHTHTHTQTVRCVLGGYCKNKKKCLVTVPGVDNGRGHAASAEKMDRTLFTGN